MSGKNCLRALFFGVVVTASSVCFSEIVNKLPGGTPLLRFAGQSQELTMIQSGDRAVVEVRIGAAGPYKFLIDTGASLSVVDTEIAAAVDYMIGEAE